MDVNRDANDLWIPLILLPLYLNRRYNSLKGTDWGDLDVLVIDMPPGTGDVQLTMCQEIDLSGAVGVTTPSKVAIADTRNGIEMFSSLGVPTLALVENMAYFEVRMILRSSYIPIFNVADA
jgi:ATP-binding protein involved in chromosome partitioning